MECLEAGYQLNHQWSKLRSSFYSMGCILKEENSTTGRVFLNIDIGRRIR